MLINKVMADNRLDALVYPTKTVPAPRLAAPLEPADLKVAEDTVTVMVNGEEYQRKIERVLDTRWALSPRLSLEFRLPDHRGPRRLRRRVYDRAVIRGTDGQQEPRRFPRSQGGRVAGGYGFSGARVQRTVVDLNRRRLRGGNEASHASQGLWAIGGRTLTRLSACAPRCAKRHDLLTRPGDRCPASLPRWIEISQIRRRLVLSPASRGHRRSAIVGVSITT